MNIINKKTVVVSTSNELKDVLEKDNRYEYIYLDNDITLESGITINKNKSKITINGTYKDILHTLIGMDSLDSTDTIICSSSTKEVKIKNIKIINTNKRPLGCRKRPTHKEWFFLSIFSLYVKS